MSQTGFLLNWDADGTGPRRVNHIVYPDLNAVKDLADRLSNYYQTDVWITPIEYTEGGPVFTTKFIEGEVIE